MKSFVKKYNQKKKHYNKIIHAHEIYNIPRNYDKNTLYSLDNSYYFDRIPINNNDFKQYLINIQNLKKFFINDKLPEKRLVDNNVVIHLRQGDAMRTERGSIINKYNKQIFKMMKTFTNKYNEYTFYIHTDSDATFLTNFLSEKILNMFFSKKAKKY